MIDYFSIALTHGLILVAAWRLLFRDDLDCEDPDAATPRRPWVKDTAAAGGPHDPPARAARDA